MSMMGFPADGGLVTNITPSTLLGLSAAWRCLDILSNGVSQLPWIERLGDLPIPNSRLTERPQAQRTRREWTSLVVSTLALYDVCYLLKVGEDSEGVPLALWYLDPTIVAPADTTLYGLDYLLPSPEYTVGGNIVSRDRLVILHRSPQPTVADQLGGIINLARTSFAAALAADRYASRYWQAGGSPTSVLETDVILPPAKKTEISDAWREKKAKGPDYAPVLDGGVKAKSFGADVTNEAAVEARKEQVADVGRYFGIPTRILNAPNGDSETYSSTESGNQDLVRYTLQNYIGAIEDAVSDVLPPDRSVMLDTYRITFPTTVAGAQANQLAVAGKAWATVEEVRARLGYPPLDADQLAALNPPEPAPATTGGFGR